MALTKAHKPSPANQHANNSSLIQQTALQRAQNEKDNQTEQDSAPDVQTALQMKSPEAGSDFIKPNALLQAKLNIGKPNDKYEKEADSIADQIVSRGSSKSEPSGGSGTPSVQKMDGYGAREGEGVQEEEVTNTDIQQKPLGDTITPLVQMKPTDVDVGTDLQMMPEEASEEVQTKLDASTEKGDTVQKMDEEEVQTSAMGTESDLQKMDEEEVQTSAMGTESDLQKMDEEPTEEVQTKLDASTERGETVQKMEEEEVQTSDMGTRSDLQKMAEEPAEDVQTKLDKSTEGGNNMVPIQQMADEEIQEKAEEEEVQEKKESTKIQASGADESTNGSSVEDSLNSSRGKGSPMDNDTRGEMESGFGKDFSGVRIHDDSNAVQMNKDLGSQAFASGNDIYFNEGKYNPSSDDGKHLLAHELTHTVQQGASTQPAVQKSLDAALQETVLSKPGTALDISHRLNLTDEWAKYLDKEYENGERELAVDVKIGDRYSGTIMVRRTNANKEGETAKYELVSSGQQKYLEVNGWSFLDPLRAAGVTPILVLNPFGDEQITTGFLSVKLGDKALTSDVLGFVKGLNENLESMQMLGITPITVGKADMENTFEAGRLNFQVNSLGTVVDGFLEAGGGMGILGDTFTFNLSTNVDVAGLASGEFTIARGEDGKLSGTGDIEADIANINAKIHVEYIDGIVTIQGTGRIESEKFSGEITLLVTDAAKSKQMMHAALGVETMDAEAENDESTPKPKSKNNQVLAGWGEVEATITPWLVGKAKVGIDAEGHITIVGEITVEDEIELMEQRGKKVDIFKLEIRAGYGIPLVGQVFLFASIGMFMNAGFGPLVLKDVGFTGTYSTDPSVLQEFAVTGTLGINAFAILGLEAEAGVGLTLLGHDVKAGVNVTAAAGLRAYAEATPTLEYKEQATPEGGKAGETRLKGHFEAAAQLFMQLSGAFFVELDAPWWSPVSDGREEYPMGEVQYPIGDSMGIGADMDWLVGSPEIPELAFSPVEFDADKFTADVMAEPPPRKLGNAEEKPDGEWVDGNAPQTDQTTDPTTKDGEGLPENKKKKEDLKKLPDEEKYMRALDEMSKLEDASPKPTKGVVDSKAEKVKKKYGLEKIKVTKKGDEAEVFVKHKGEDNGNHKLMVPLMSEAERTKLLGVATSDLSKKTDKAAGEDGTIEEATAKDLLTTWKTAHPIIGDAKVVDGKDTWDYFIDLGDKELTEKGKKKNLEQEVDPEEEAKKDLPSIFALTEHVNTDGGHDIKIEGTEDNVEINVYSKKKTIKQLVTDKNIELTEADPSAVDNYEEKMEAIGRLKKEIDDLYAHVGNYKVAVDNAYKKGGGNTPVKVAYESIQVDLGQLAKDLMTVGILEDNYDLPVSHVEFDFKNGRAEGLVGSPISKIPGNTHGSTPKEDPLNWHKIPVGLRSAGKWVRAHLLNHRLHGPGIQENLFPGTRKMNLDDMEAQVESPSKDAVWDDNKIIHYEVSLTYGNTGDFEDIPTDVTMVVYEYDLKNKKEDKSKKVASGNFTQKTPDEVEVLSFNSSTPGALKGAASRAKVSGLSGIFFDKVVKARSSYGKYNDIDDIEEALQGKEKYKDENAFKAAFSQFQILDDKNVISYE